ncbi:MAG: prenyltransferase [Acidimicrobiales bacterium]
MNDPRVPGIVTADELHATADTIEAVQLPNGMIQWFPGGHADPWNHVEAAMALATMGRVERAERAYDWLVDRQRPDGSWHNYYLADGIEDAKLDVNCVAYVATGVWHHLLVTGDEGFAERLFPVVARAMEFVLDLQTRRGEIIWARKPDGMPWSYALLTGSSSVGHSLTCAVRLAEVVGAEAEAQRWGAARRRLVEVIVNQPEAFEPKDRWAMDWYYPVLTGAVTGDDATKRMIDRWDEFVMEERGVRCVSDRPWVTAAETCECAMAALAAGDRTRALDLYRWAQELRDERGAYFTGIVHPERIHYPDDERSSYTAAAVILAADALCGTNATSGLFVDHE